MKNNEKIMNALIESRARKVNGQKPKKVVKESANPIESALERVSYVKNYFNSEVPTKEQVINCYNLAKKLMRSVGDNSEPEFDGFSFVSNNISTAEKICKSGIIDDWDNFDYDGDYYDCCKELDYNKYGNSAIVIEGDYDNSDIAFRVCILPEF